MRTRVWAHRDTATGPRAVLVSQQPRSREGVQAYPTMPVLPYALRAGTAGGPFVAGLQALWWWCPDAPHPYCLLAKTPLLAMLLPMLQEHPFRSVRGSPRITRRKFLAASSATLMVGALDPAKSAAAEESVSGPKLALNGGEKAVKLTPKLAVRWGEPERERLNAMLGQDSLFYWKGPNTTLFIERFKRVCPMKYV